MDNCSKPVTLYIFRHGQTAWSRLGQHTGRTDIPLTDTGREQARALRNAIAHIDFSAILVSPLSRARETAELAGMKDVRICADLSEFHYGNYEGLTTEQIRKEVPGWTVWTHPTDGGETLAQAAERCKNVIDTATGIGGKVAVFAHGHILRILTATWLELKPQEGKHFMLDTSTISVLSHERETPAIKIWNSPTDLISALS
ncbi:MAG: histidine phosphatase family protein [Candidatus Obscuribacterales bacterium]|nr:histidine phosphatase family protein [Candidatus Obscuribacterales bacterium]